MTYEINDRTLASAPPDQELIRRHTLVAKIKANKLLRTVWNFFRKLRHAGGTSGASDSGFGKPENIAIIYRHVYITQDQSRFPQKFRPAQFSHDKCFRNLVESIENDRNKNVVKLIIYYNGTRDQFLSDPFSAFLESISFKAEVFLLSTKSALEAVLVLLRETLSMDMSDSDIVYFLENDYLHHPDWVSEVLKAYSSDIRFEYLSLYDHPDRYKIPKNYAGTELFATDSRHWVSAPSTCGSFLVQFGQFKKDFKYLYSTKNDHQMFSRLTGKLGRRLITPVPGLAVHSMADHLDPVQRFEEYFKRAGNE